MKQITESELYEIIRALYMSADVNQVYQKCTMWALSDYLAGYDPLSVVQPMRNLINSGKVLSNLDTASDPLSAYIIPSLNGKEKM